MSSSISSSELVPVSNVAKRNRRLALLAVLALLLLLEVVTRRFLFSASKDFKRFASYPAKAQELGQAGDFRIALVGNSATDRGVTETVVAEAFTRATQRAAHVAMFPADQSRINTWHYIAESSFFDPGVNVDLLVLTFYEDDLADGNAVEIGRLAQFFTKPSDWPSIFGLDLPVFGDQVEFVLSSYWATLAGADRIRERLLKLLVPNYEDFVASVHDVNRRHARPLPEKAVTHEALRRFLERASSRGQRVAFVAYPTLTEDGRSPYEFESEMLSILAEANAPLVDLRHIPTLNPTLYADEVHLTDEGRKPYSEALGAALSKVVGEQVR